MNSITKSSVISFIMFPCLDERKEIIMNGRLILFVVLLGLICSTNQFHEGKSEEAKLMVKIFTF